MNGLIVATVAVAAGVVGSVTASQHAVPAWMNHTCAHRYSVNCWQPRDRSYVRQVPGSTGMVCVFYVHRTRRDYCS